MPARKSISRTVRFTMDNDDYFALHGVVAQALARLSVTRNNREAAKIERAWRKIQGAWYAALDGEDFK